MTGVALFDIHYPYQDKNALNAVCQFISDVKPEILVYGGDQLDQTPVSHWLVNNLRDREGKRLKTDYDNFNSDILSRMEKLSNWKEKVWIIGNHEYWIEKYIDEHPELEGLIEPEGYFDLKKRGYKIIPFNSCYRIGRMSIIRGLYINQFHAKKTLDTWGESSCVYYGHKHDFQVYSAIFRGGDGLPRLASSCGCLCNLNPDFKKGTPNNWCHGFLYFQVRRDGTFTSIVIPIINGRFSFNKKTYG